MRKEKMPDLGSSRARACTRAAWAVAFTLVLISSLPSTSRAQAQFKTLHRFSPRSANTPLGALVADPQGNLYGTTDSGGANNFGTVFELAPDGHGGWKEKVLHSFNGTDGAYPSVGLIFDAAGSLYGTTGGGGAYGDGTVFELAPDGHGGWKERVLHSFDGTDGQFPYADLIFDATGNLYSTTYGGATGYGVVFELAPDGHGGWKETVLYSFTGYHDGESPHGALIFDAAGNLYGTTDSGGADFLGTVFELSPDGHGGWKKKVLYSFSVEPDGNSPEGSVIFDAAGNLYGTTFGGGANNVGTVFELAADGRGGWKERVLHSFNGTDGLHPEAALIFDATGNLYSTTYGDGVNSVGTVFELAPNGHGGWKETVLHSFKDRPGAAPSGSLIFDNLGNLYGTTSGDSSTTFGSVFEITP